jgi:hypothetical protein
MKTSKISILFIILFTVACSSNNGEKEHGHEHNSEEEEHGHPHHNEENSETPKQEEFIIEKDTAVQVKSKSDDHGHSHDEEHNHNH